MNHDYWKWYYYTKLPICNIKVYGINISSSFYFYIDVAGVRILQRVRREGIPLYDARWHPKENEIL